MDDVKMYLKKRWVVMVSVLTAPLCNLGGYTKVSHADSLTTQTCPSPHPPLCLKCSVWSHLCIIVVFSAVCHSPLTFPSLSSPIPQCKYMQYRGWSGNHKLPSHQSGTSRKPRLRCSLVKQQRDIIYFVSKLQLHPLCHLLIACTG